MVTYALVWELGKKHPWSLSCRNISPQGVIIHSCVVSVKLPSFSGKRMWKKFSRQLMLSFEFKFKLLLLLIYIHGITLSMVTCNFVSSCKFKCAVLPVSEILQFLKMASIKHTCPSCPTINHFPPAILSFPVVEIPCHQLIKPVNLELLI